ncbi:hypothetical protein EAG_08375 [Camponotus floridanus]|uniref:Uncharacterized protein n=1 Tax=Camponotus floridanus TaxID=104421 RepID=E2AMZ9_CAMFO|nr:hypothetical protein EAG_08375 [Camponotus floridanus]
MEVVRARAAAERRPSRYLRTGRQCHKSSPAIQKNNPEISKRSNIAELSPIKTRAEENKDRRYSPRLGRSFGPSAQHHRAGRLRRAPKTPRDGSRPRSRSPEIPYPPPANDGGSKYWRRRKNFRTSCVKILVAAADHRRHGTAGA